MSRYFSLRGLVRGLLPCLIFASCWTAWAIGYVQGALERPEPPMSLSKTI
ncbi:hypothetical protein MCEMIEM12_01975 [Burkholderiaceae bacterium]